MFRPNPFVGLLVLGASWACAQEAPKYFELVLPDISESPIGGGKTLIEIPDRPIERLGIIALNAQQRNIVPGSYRVFVNGKGIGNVLDEKNIDIGTLLSMEPSNLRMRPDELFDPRENTIEITAADRRGRKYYQNWVIRSGGSSNPYFTYSTTISPADPRGVPPDLALEQPSAPVVLEPGQAKVAVAVKGRLAAAAPGATLTLNGGPLVPATAQPAVAFAQQVTVDRLAKELLFEATDRRGNKRRVSVPVIVKEKAPPKFRFAGQKYALLIGIAEYGTAKDAPPPLPGVMADVGELARLLETKAGFKKENIRLLANERATLGQIRVAYSDFVAKAQGTDMLVVYVAARGVHDPRSGKNSDLYLAVHGTSLNQLESTALSFSDIEMTMNRYVRCNQSFLIFDVGHELTGDWRFPGRNVVNNHLLNLFEDQKGRSVIVSGSADEVSLGSAEGQAAGVFARALGQGLAGAADRNADGLVTGSELFRFVSDSVSRDSKGAQNPRFRLSKSNQDAPVGSP